LNAKTQKENVDGQARLLEQQRNQNVYSKDIWEENKDIVVNGQKSVLEQNVMT